MGERIRRIKRLILQDVNDLIIIRKFNSNEEELKKIKLKLKKEGYHG